MYDFTYQKPASLADAVKAIAAAEDGKLMAGGMTLIPTLKQRLARPTDVIDLGKIAELAGIKKDGSAIVIGAMTRHADVAHSNIVKSAIPALADLADGIGDPQVRNRGTLGGSIANNDPAADYPGAVVALGATVATNKRMIAGDDFFTGMFETALEPAGRQGCLCQIPQSGLALRDRRRLCRQERGGRARRGNRRRPMRLPRARDGAGARQVLLGRRDQVGQGRGVRPQL